MAEDAFGSADTASGSRGLSGRLVQPEGMALDSLLVESLELCMAEEERN